MRASSSGIQKFETTSPACCDPGAIAWNYTRSETIADLGVHVTGLCLGITAATVLLALAATRAATRDFVAASLYTLGLLSMLALSAAYNLWPVCPMKWRLRRFDHSAIYVLIACTYTTFALDMKAGTIALLIGVWCVAALGIALKLALPGRLDRLSIGVYVIMGWSGAILLSGRASSIPPEAFRFLVAGGILLSVGVIFHIWRALRFQNAIWHFFVLLGITCHYAAVFKVVLS
jgi:hemolysin III